MRHAERNAASSAVPQSSHSSPESRTKVFKPVVQKYPVLDYVGFLRLPQVIEVTGLKKTSIYNRMREKTFPLSVQLGPRTVGWIASEVDQWVAERIAESRPQPATANLLRPSARASST
jgi:prophage regulatory protein